MSDYDIALAVVTVVLCCVIFVVNIYVLVSYQHPDDYNQAYFPKIVVVLGLTIAQISILMLPADVANSKACESEIVIGACKFTLPMKTLWYIVWITDAVFIFFIIPFSMFFYEEDEDRRASKRAIHALLWCLAIAAVVGAILGGLFAGVGYVDFPVRRLASATVDITDSFTELTASLPCLSPYPKAGRKTCGSYTATTGSFATLTLRSSFPMYVVALCTIVGSCLFSIFGGVGIAALPLSAIGAFLRRPKAIISRAQYIKEATELGKRARELRDLAQAIRKEERGGFKSWNWRKNVRMLQQELAFLEEDDSELQERFPQGEEAELSWAFTMLLYVGKLVGGIIGLFLSIAWILHIILYMLVQPPATTFLNQVFIKLDNAWGLLGTAAFTFFCFYLLLAVMAGEMYLGLNFAIFSIHPMKVNGTLMSSFLFNVALIMCCSISVIQFCAKAFGEYAESTAVWEIFGHTLENLRGVRYLYIYNVFQIAFVASAGITAIWYFKWGWKKKKRSKSRKRVTQDVTS